MYLCPRSGFVMRPARAAGAPLYYCSASRGRMVTLEMAKRFLGETAATELWIRAEVSQADDQTACPSCRRPMRKVKEPKWIGPSTAWICRSCHLFWFEPDTHQQIPHPEDLLTPEGDGTVLKDAGRALGEFVMGSEKARFEAHEDPRSDAPSFPMNLAGFLGLPVESSNKLVKIWPVVTHLLIATIIGIHFFVTSKDPGFISQFGFVPADPFKNYGANLLLGPFIHANWLHLWGNVYFFVVFADDIEELLGAVGFLFMMLLGVALTQLGTMLLSGSPTIPHVGLSGLISSVLVLYALSFPKQRLIYLMPGYRYFGAMRGEALPAKMLVSRWLAVRAIYAVPGYVALDLLRWYWLERQGLSHVAHSAHLSGAIFGLIFFLLLRLTEPADSLPHPKAPVA